MKTHQVKTAWAFVIFLFMAFFTGNTLLAQAGDPKIDITIKVEKEVRELVDGKWATRYVPVETTQQNDILLYSLTYTNTGETEALDAAIIDPIPKEAVYNLGSATGEDAEIACSIDGGLSFLPPPIWMKFKKPDGTVEKRPAPADRYTHVRWIISKPLPPGQSGRVSLKVTVK